MMGWLRRNNVVRQSSQSGTNNSAGRDQVNIHMSVTSTPRNVQVERLVQVYEWHGVHRLEVPQFVAECGGPALEVPDVATDEALTRRLRRDLVDFTTDVFGLHPDYLWHMPAQVIFKPNHIYGHVWWLPRFFLIDAVLRSGEVPSTRLLEELGNQCPLPELWLPDSVRFVDPKLYLLFGRGHHGTSETPETLVAAVYRVHVVTFRDRTIYRYHTFDVEPYDYHKVRRDVAMALDAAKKCSVAVRMFWVTDARRLTALGDGETFPLEFAEFDGYDEQRGSTAELVSLRDLPDLTADGDNLCGVRRADVLADLGPDDRIRHVSGPRQEVEQEWLALQEDRSEAQVAVDRECRTSVKLRQTCENAQGRPGLWDD